MTTLLRTLAVLILAVTGTSCAAPPPPPAPAPDAEALAAYQRYWDVVDAAFAAPASQDWSGRLAGVATGPALESVKVDVENYAGIPAHQVGQVRRSPTVAQSGGDRVGVLDCIDISGTTLVADRSGQVLDDTANSVPRYRFRADVVRANGQWLVERTSPLLDQPC